MLFFFVTSAFSQQARPDTSQTSNEGYFEGANDSLEILPDYMPGDVIFIPSEVLYDHAWNNTIVRAQRKDLSQMEDTLNIFLENPSEGRFRFPFRGKLLSPFGYRGRHFHAGVDIKLNLGDSVICAFDGKVRLARKYRGYGNVVVVRHFNGIETVYAHLSKIKVEINQDIKAGELIGLGGRTGRATTTHLHFETRFLGEPFNPTTFIDLSQFRLISDTLAINGTLFNYGAPQKKGSRHKRNKTTEEPVTPAKNFAIHRVKKGETLADIARANNTTVQKLSSINHLKKSRKLKVGQKLKVK